MALIWHLRRMNAAASFQRKTCRNAGNPGLDCIALDTGNCGNLRLVQPPGC